MQMKHADNTYSNFDGPLLNPTEFPIRPGKQTVIHPKSQIYTENEVTGIIQPSTDLEDNDDLIICPDLTTSQNRQFTLPINNFSELPYTLRKRCHIAIFSILMPKQAKYIKPINAATIRHISDTNHDDTIQYSNAILQRPKSEDFNETYWFPTSREPGDEIQHTPKQKSIIHELIALQKLEHLNRPDNQESCKQFLSSFDGTDITLDKGARKALEDLLVEIHGKFTRNIFDIGINSDFKLKLTHFVESPDSTQRLPTSINLKEVITVELAILHRYGTT